MRSRPVHIPQDLEDKLKVLRLESELKYLSRSEYIKYALRKHIENEKDE